MLQGRLLLWGSHLESFKIALSICSMWWAGDCLCVSVYEGNFDSPESKEQIFAQSVILLWRNRQVETPKGVTPVLQLPCPPLSQTTAGKSSLFPLQGSLEGLSIHPKPLELLSPFFPTQLNGIVCQDVNAAAQMRPCVLLRCSFKGSCDLQRSDSRKGTQGKHTQPALQAQWRLAWYLKTFSVWGFEDTITNNKDFTYISATPPSAE